MPNEREPGRGGDALAPPETGLHSGAASAGCGAGIEGGGGAALGPGRWGGNPGSGKPREGFTDVWELAVGVWSGSGGGTVVSKGTDYKTDSLYNKLVFVKNTNGCICIRRVLKKCMPKR